jgi:thymidylate synthase (FAD)
MKIIKPSVELFDYTRFAEVTIEWAARHSTRTTDQSTGEAFARNLIAKGHFTPLRFATATFTITADRGVIDELRTHQHADFVVESTRYCGYDKERFGGELEFVEPPFDTSADKTEWEVSCQAAEGAYKILRSRGVKPELARSVLPLSIACRCAIHANFQEWRHILSMRLAPTAHPQIRQVMAMVMAVFKERWPVIVEDLEVAK